MHGGGTAEGCSQVANFWSFYSGVMVLNPIDSAASRYASPVMTKNRRSSCICGPSGPSVEVSHLGVITEDGKGDATMELLLLVIPHCSPLIMHACQALWVGWLTRIGGLFRS